MTNKTTLKHIIHSMTILSLQIYFILSLQVHSSLGTITNSVVILTKKKKENDLQSRLNNIHDHDF